MIPDDALAALRRYPLLEALRERRSRRFGLGMALPAGPLAHRSRHQGLRLTEGEEALLAFAACGITGYALADLAYVPGQGGTIMAGLLGRTVASGDAIQSVGVVVTNADSRGWGCDRRASSALRQHAQAPPSPSSSRSSAGKLTAGWVRRRPRSSSRHTQASGEKSRWWVSRPVGSAGSARARRRSARWPVI